MTQAAPAGTILATDVGSHKLMAATEMRIASSLGLPVTVVVFADNSLNRIELRWPGWPPGPAP